MPSLTRVVASLGVAGALTLTPAGSAVAGPSPTSAFGQNVASCAQEHLGQRTSPPQVICDHDGMTMTFPNFGAMVQHMREMDDA